MEIWGSALNRFWWKQICQLLGPHERPSVHSRHSRISAEHPGLSIPDHQVGVSRLALRTVGLGMSGRTRWFEMCGSSGRDNWIEIVGSGLFGQDHLVGIVRSDAEIIWFMCFGNTGWECRDGRGSGSSSWDCRVGIFVSRSWNLVETVKASLLWRDRRLGSSVGDSRGSMGWNRVVRADSNGRNRQTGIIGWGQCYRMLTNVIGWGPWWCTT